MKIVFTLIGCIISTLLLAQTTQKVLFIGNSYTYVNDLPGLVSQLADAEGNQLIYDSNTPGGYQLSQHATNATTLSKIASKAWDFVVIQEQSQKPSFPDAQVEATVYPYASILVDSIYANDSCSVPLFYDTWGRQNGDPQWEGINTFEKMNTRLFHAYETMTNTAKGMLSPVGVGYLHIHNDSNAVVNFSSLYQGDESHPTIFGSYLGACIFNNLIFSTSSTGNSFIPSGMNATEAHYLQTVADHVVYAVDSVRTDYRLLSNNSFTYTKNGLSVELSPSIQSGSFNSWIYSDQTSSTIENDVHSFLSDETYTIGMITSTHCYSDTLFQSVTINTAGITTDEKSTSSVYPNPSWDGTVFIKGEIQQPYFIYSIKGQLIYNGKAKSLQLRKGVYLMYFGRTYRKIIVL